MENVMCHHGIKGQKWGVRRYQNPDGTWTDAGKRRYGDGESDGREKTGSSTKKKVAIGVATGAAVVAGTVLTAYLVKKYGAKNLSTIAEKAPAGKEVIEDLLKNTSVASTPVSKIQAPKVEPQQVLERVVKSTPTPSASISQVSPPKVSVNKPIHDIPPAYSFETLMKQNDELLKKMLAGLA